MGWCDFAGLAEPEESGVGTSVIRRVKRNRIGRNATLPPGSAERLSFPAPAEITGELAMVNSHHRFCLFQCQRRQYRVRSGYVRNGPSRRHGRAGDSCPVPVMPLVLPFGRRRTSAAQRGKGFLPVHSVGSLPSSALAGKPVGPDENAVVFRVCLSSA